MVPCLRYTDYGTDYSSFEFTYYVDVKTVSSIFIASCLIHHTLFIY